MSNFQLAQNKTAKVYSQKATQSGDKLGRFIPHKNKEGPVKVTINEDGEEVRLINDLRF
jgi:hypothetical protein